MSPCLKQSHGTLSARFQEVHFTKCFKQWCDDHWAHCIKSQEVYLEVVWCCYGEVNAERKLFYHNI